MKASNDLCLRIINRTDFMHIRKHAEKVQKMTQVILRGVYRIWRVSVWLFLCFSSRCDQVLIIDLLLLEGLQTCQPVKCMLCSYFSPIYKHTRELTYVLTSLYVCPWRDL